MRNARSRACEGGDVQRPGPVSSEPRDAAEPLCPPQRDPRCHFPPVSSSPGGSGGRAQTRGTPTATRKSWRAQTLGVNPRQKASPNPREVWKLLKTRGSELLRQNISPFPATGPCRGSQGGSTTTAHGDMPNPGIPSASRGHRRHRPPPRAPFHRRQPPGGLVGSVSRREPRGTRAGTLGERLRGAGEGAGRPRGRGGRGAAGAAGAPAGKPSAPSRSGWICTLGGRSRQMGRRGVKISTEITEAFLASQSPPRPAVMTPSQHKVKTLPQERRGISPGGCGGGFPASLRAVSPHAPSFPFTLSLRSPFSPLSSPRAGRAAPSHHISPPVTVGMGTAGSPRAMQDGRGAPR